MPIPPTSTSKYGFWALNGLLGLAFVAEFFVPPSVALDGLLIVLAAGASVVGHDRQLPLQNALSAALICAAVGGLAHGLSAQRDLALPFGPVLFNPAAGWKILNFVPMRILLLLICLSGTVFAQSSARFDITRGVIAGGGTGID